MILKKGYFTNTEFSLASLCVCVCDHPPVVSFTTLKSKSACSKSSSFRPQLGLCVKNLCCCTKFTSTAISIKLVSMSLLRLMLILTRDWWNASNCMHFFSRAIWYVWKTIFQNNIHQTRSTPRRLTAITNSSGGLVFLEKNQLPRVNSLYLKESLLCHFDDLTFWCFALFCFLRYAAIHLPD